MNKWISAEDSKPEIGLAVLIHLKISGMITVGYRKSPSDGYDQTWQLFGDTDMLIDKNDSISHWQYLPEAPTII